MFTSDLLYIVSNLFTHVKPVKVYVRTHVKITRQWKSTFTLICIFPFYFYPLTPVPPVTTRDEPWPFFLFWRHHFWPKLASSILNFCRRERSFQWCPDLSERANGALDMHKNAQKVEWKTRSKISCHFTWLLHAKNCLPQRRFIRSFLTASKPSRRSITAAKRRENEKKEWQKKFQKSKSLKTGVTFSIKILVSAHAVSQCTKMRCWWRERQAVVFQTHFGLD